MKNIFAKYFERNVNENAKELTEENVLKSIGYKDPSKILMISVPVKCSRGRCGLQDEVYGHMYLTEKGKQDLESVKKGSKDREKNAFYELFIKDDSIPLETLGEAIKKYPHHFDPKQKNSIFSTYNSREIVEAYEGNVAVILRKYLFPKQRLIRLYN